MQHKGYSRAPQCRRKPITSEKECTEEKKKKQDSTCYQQNVEENQLHKKREYIEEEKKKKDLTCYQ